jgi:hypothetical protein
MKNQDKLGIILIERRWEFPFNRTVNRGAYRWDKNESFIDLNKTLKHDIIGYVIKRNKSIWKAYPY